MSKRKTKPLRNANASIALRSNWTIKPLAAVSLIVVLVAATYFPALFGDQIWDDNGHITKPELRTLGGLFRIWFSIGATQQYYPFLHSAFWIEHRLWGDSMLGYHLVNVLLHATAACLVFFVLRRLKIPGALLAAAIFA